jgi:hypothetical protein
MGEGIGEGGGPGLSGGVWEWVYVGECVVEVVERFTAENERTQS